MRRVSASVKITAGVYFLLLIYLLFFASFREGTTTVVNLVPFKTLWPLTEYTFRSGQGWWHWIVNVPGNLVAFIPFGIVFWVLEWSSWKKILLAGILISGCLEILQLLFKTGSCDVDDILLNSLGVLLGFQLAKKFGKQPAN